MVHLQREGLVLILHIPSLTLESTINITNINSPFLLTTNTLFLDGPALGADDLSGQAVYRIAVLRKLPQHLLE